MKKSLFVLCAAMALMASCKKEEAPKVDPALKLVSEAAVTVSQEGDIINVEFTSNVAWKAELSADKSIATASPLSGAATGEASAKIKVNVTPLTEDNAVRNFTLTITPEGGAPAKVEFTQNGPYAPFFNVDAETLTFGAEGGTQTFTINTNVEYDLSEPSVGTLSINGSEATYAIPANEKLGGVSDRIKFTVTDIQVPALDEEGNETGDLTDLVVRVNIAQDGNAVKEWEVAIDGALKDDMASIKNTNIAVVEGNLLVANGSDQLYVYDAATGAYQNSVTFPFAITGIAADEAGNVVIMEDGSYNNPTILHVAPKASVLDPKAYNKVLETTNNFYGGGYKNLTVIGNMLSGKALAEVFSGSGSYDVCWTFTDGKYDSGDATNTDYVTLPSEELLPGIGCTMVWNGKNGAAKHISTDINGGVLYSAYDGNYSLFYNPGMTSANWAVAAEPKFADWSRGCSSLEIVEYKGHKCVVSHVKSFFDYMPDVIEIYNIDNAAAAEFIDSVTDITTKDSLGDVNTDYDITCDLVAVTENGNLVVYSISGVLGHIVKYNLGK